jgi:uncharacterized protein YjeT (DUF2065 family)
MADVKKEVQQAVTGAKPWGMDIVDVRITRVDYVESITESVYRRMEAERKRVANELRSTGAAEGEKIRADADRQREITMANAYRDAQKIKGEGDAEAARVYNDAFGRDPQFAQFYRSLEAYKSSFNKKSDVMVLDPSSEFFAMRGPGAALPLLPPPAAEADGPPSTLDSSSLWQALALVLVIEGLLPFVSPGRWRSTFAQILQLNDGQLRFFGLLQRGPGLAGLVAAEPELIGLV